MAVQKVLAIYNDLMSNSFNEIILSDDGLEKLHKKCSSDSLNLLKVELIFNRKVFGEGFIEKINEMMDYNFEMFKRINEEKEILNRKIELLEIEAERSRVRERRYVVLENSVRIYL
jgi:hypothetical protein